MALLPVPKPLAASLTAQPRKLPTNASPRAVAALANVGRTAPVKPPVDPSIGVSKPVNPAGNAAMRAAAAATAGAKPVGPRMMAPGRPRGLGTAIKA
jgi:hypothetical protein